MNETSINSLLITQILGISNQNFTFIAVYLKKKLFVLNYVNEFCNYSGVKFSIFFQPRKNGAIFYHHDNVIQN